MYSFAQRTDTQVVDEPLYGYYLSISGAEHPGREEVLSHMDQNGSRVINHLLHTDYGKPCLFIKNMAHHLMELDQYFLSEMTHLLLIRDPNEMLPSLVHQIPNPKMIDTALQMQWDLYQNLVKMGPAPLIIDSKQLLLNPEKILRQVCSQLELPYQPEMTSWESGPREEDGIWAKYWYHNVHKSRGFAQYKPKNEAVREDLQTLLVACQQYYEQLYDQALKA